MIDSIKEWVIAISTMVIIISAVEMILPSNSIKKYCKFVMGLILMIVIINPIIGLFNSAAEVSVSFDNYKMDDSHFQYSDMEKYRENSIDNTLSVWKEKLQVQFENKLKEKHPKKDFQVEVDVGYDEDNAVFVINDVKVGVESKQEIRRIKPVLIGKASETSGLQGDSMVVKEVIETIKDSFQIDDDRIEVFYSEDD